MRQVLIILFATFCGRDSRIRYLGNVYIADTFNCRIRKVTISTGIITTIAGTGFCAYSGDNGQATSATLNYVRAVALDSAGISFSI